MYIVLDLETTGLSPKSDKIIECAFVKFDRKTFKEVDRLHTFIQPGIPIPDLISSITHIYDSDVETAPHIEDMRDDIEDFIQWLPIVGHNISFDMSFLEGAGVDVSKNPVIDTFSFANFLCYQEKSLNLWYLCDVFSIQLESAHRAIDDTLATLELFRCLVEKLQNLATEKKKLIYSLLSLSTNSGMKIFLHDFCDISEKMYGKDDIFPEYLKLFQKNMYDKTDKIHFKSWTSIESIWKDLWVLEKRESQNIMIDNIDKTFSQWKKILIEAPTGTGKTFAYLIPAIKFSLTTGEQVHISTSTKALQDQIFYKDLEKLSENISEVFSFTKLKWKSNYLSMFSLCEAISSCDMSDPVIVSIVSKIFLWSLTTEFWELDELDFYGKEYEFVSEIHAANSWVQSDINIYREYEFIDAARNRAKKSNIVITNNNILFRDILWDGNILWELKNLVIDEAHTLEDVATSSLKESVSYKRISILWEKLKEKAKKYDSIDAQIWEKFIKMMFDAEHVFWILEWLLFSKVSRNMKYKTYLMSEDDFLSQHDLQILLLRVWETILEIQKLLWGDDIQEFISVELRELDSLFTFFQKLSSKRDINSQIYYISHNDTIGLEICITVLNVWNFLSQNLWSRLESCVLTSATLRMNEGFWFIQSSLWWEAFETVSLPTDFDYSKQSLVYIPNDLWSIKHNISEVAHFLEQLSMQTRWRILWLFTSYASIRDIYVSIEKTLTDENIHLLAQSISWWKHKLIEYFKKNADSSVLLWTNTFWEWLDIPGNDLQYVVIHKIPFPVPNDPIFQARSKLYKNSFEEYAIPKAIIKVQQWFGRLIRSKSDTWVCIFLDDRIYSTSWWRVFLQSFPKDITIRYGSSQKLFNTLQAGK